MLARRRRRNAPTLRTRGGGARAQEGADPHVADHGGQGAVALACALEQQGGTTTATTTKATAAAAVGGEAVGRARSVAAVLQDTDLQFCNATVRACRALRDGRDAAALDACSRALDLGGY